ncbi:YdcF family protein [Lachnospira pectinoschiza]|uniref:Uncharacterized SAM-binding protein YcdF, DUF218 family n=1 Tax=Lachnospira pectinoschiza TaxID=28052 RepID=A0A1G9YGT9_9FIRM|nr:YdcF family protein [Lachnospira pectinoschiza]SDN07693.1 Uncharacterized SAM-binding protein YcdF, DUF218 family [Lachnospira pectinoschiza]
MENVFLIVGLLSALYYIICVSYAGFKLSFVFMWIIISAFFIVLYLLKRLEKSGRIKIHKIIKRIFWSVFTLGLALFIVLEGLILSGFAKMDKENNYDYIIVLGCLVKEAGPSKALKLRLDAALELANIYDCPIIVSGGQGPNEPMTEADAMAEYLIDKGVSEDRIIKEDRSINTDENLANSYEIIKDSKAKVLIVSTNFHIFRARLIAKKTGFENVYSYPAKSDMIILPNFMLREAIGITKDFILGNL